MDPPDSLEILRVDLEECSRPIKPCIIDQHVHASELFPKGLHLLGNCFRVRNVRDKPQSTGSDFLDNTDGFRCGFRVPVEDSDCRAFSCQAESRCPPDSLACSRDQGDLADESSRDFTLSTLDRHIYLDVFLVVIR